MTARPAIEGGTPVRRAMLPYGRQSIGEADIAAVTEVLRSDWLTGGPAGRAFEEAFADAVGARHAVSFSSATAGLHAAVAVAGAGPGDEGITSPLTFVASANAIIYEGARPVLADVRDDTLTLDPAAVERAITPRTRVIVAVDYAGHPADLDPLGEIATAHGCTLIEDAAHSPGARYRGRPVGSIAPLTVFSFHPVKHIATGEGGMVTTGDAAMAERLRAFRNHGIDRDFRARTEAADWVYDATTLGYNYRLSDIAAALGLGQVRTLSENIATRRAIAARYDKFLQEMEAVRLPSVDADAEPAWHLYPVRLRLDRLRVDRGQVFRALRAENIGVNVHYVPVHHHSHFRGRFGDLRGTLPVAEGAYEQLISLPMFHAMTEADVDDVVEGLRKVIGFYAA